jgi:hypothetical protein
VRRIVADEISRRSSDEVAETLAKHTGAHLPKRQIEELAIRGARDFDAFYADRSLAPEPTAADHLIVLSFDGKGLAMLHEHLRDAMRLEAGASLRKLHTRLIRGEKPNSRRMAQVATVDSVVPYERTITDVRHGLVRRDPADRPRPCRSRSLLRSEAAAPRLRRHLQQRPVIIREVTGAQDLNARGVVAIERRHSACASRFDSVRG